MARVAKVEKLDVGSSGSITSGPVLFQAEVERDALADALKLAASATRGTNIPIAQCALIRAVGEQLEVVGTDTQVTQSTRVDAKCIGGEAVAVPASIAAKTMAQMPKGIVKLMRDNNKLVVSAGKVRYDLQVYPWREFPRTPSDEGAVYARVGAQNLANAIRIVEHAQFPSAARQYLNCVRFELVGPAKSRFAATDGQRLVVSEEAGLFETVDGFFPGAAAHVSPRGVIELRRAIGDAETAEVAVDEKYVHLRVGATRCSVHLLDVQFPPYEDILPKPRRNTCKFSVQAGALAASLERMLHVGAAVIFSSNDGSLEMEVEEARVGTARESLDVEHMRGPETCCRFNAAYLREWLTQLGPEEVVKLDMSPVPDAPLYMSAREDSYLGVVMPMLMKSGEGEKFDGEKHLQKAVTRAELNQALAGSGGGGAADPL